MATICWFQKLRLHAGAKLVADVARYYSPSLEPPPDQMKRLHREWTERATGERSPSAKLIAFADQRCPASAAVFDEAIWPALRTDWPAKRQRAEVQKRLMDDSLRNHVTLIPGQEGERLVRAMKQSASLDDFACLLLLMRSANDSGASRASYGLSKAINHVLLLQAGWLMAHGLLCPLVEYVDAEFFRRAPEAWSVAASAATYAHMLQWLVKAVPHHMPQVVDGFDSQLWFRGAGLALSLVEAM